MRIAFVDQAGDKPGGAEESLTLMLKHLPSDIIPSVILFEDGEFAERMRKSGYSTTIFPLASELKVLTREKPSSRSVLSLPAVVRRLTSILAPQRYDLVHTNTVKAHLIAGPAARLARTPVVMHLRDMVGGIGRAAIQGAALAASSERIAISNPLARWYHLPKTIVVSNPVDLSTYVNMPARTDARQQLNIPLDGAPLIGIVGRINRWKGHDHFLRIAAEVNRAVPIRCAIVGEARFRDSDFIPELHRLAENLGIGERVTFVPWLADPRVAYAALDIHCNCSVREPFGRSIVEAGAAGVPTIAFNDGGAADIIRDGVDGRLIEAGNDRAFAGAIIELLRDPMTLAATSRAAQDGSFRFDAANHGRLMTDILRRNARAR